MRTAAFRALARPLYYTAATRSYALSAVRRAAYAEVSYMPDEDTPKAQFAFADVQGSISSLKAMLKTNPTDLEKNNARRSLCSIASHVSGASHTAVAATALSAKQVLLILNGILHTASLPNPIVAGKPSVDLSPIYRFIEDALYGASGAPWAPADMIEVLKVCIKIRNVPIVGVLGALVRPCIAMADGLKPAELVVFARAFHVFGIGHPHLTQKILGGSLKNIDKLSADDLNSILATMVDEPNGEQDSETLRTLLETLMSKATKNIKIVSAPIASRCLHNLILCQKNYPVLSAALKNKIADFQAVLHARALETMSCAPVQDVVAICASFAALLDKERFEPIFKLTAERVTSLARNLKPRQIAMLFHSCARHRILDEDLLNMLAEKSCSLMPEFDEGNMADAIESLASFDLYDAELFTAVASRLAQKTRDREVLEPLAVVRAIEAFAKIKERSDTALFAGAQQCILNMYCLDKPMMERALAVFKQFKFNHKDIIQQLEARVKGEDGLKDKDKGKVAKAA